MIKIIKEDVQDNNTDQHLDVAVEIAIRDCRGALRDAYRSVEHLVDVLYNLPTENEFNQAVGYFKRNFSSPPEAEYYVDKLKETLYDATNAI